MRKVIKHIRYDTDKSQLLAVTDTGIISELLYRTLSGHYFSITHDALQGPQDQLVPLSETQAIALYNKLLLKNPKHNPKERS